MKVIHVITSTGVGGAQIMLSRYLCALNQARKNHSVVSLMSAGPISDELTDAGVRVQHLGVSPGIKSLGALRALRKKLSSEAPDLIFGWMYHGCLAAMVGRAGLRNTALVWGIHHSLADVKAEKASTRAVLKALAAFSHRVDGISYCSSTSRAQHETIGFASDRVRVIPNAIDAAVFQPDRDARARLAKICGFADDRKIIGNVARSHPMKDHVAMVRAVAKLLDAGRDVHGVLMGEGLSESAAKQEASALGIADRVSFLETRDDVASLVPGFDVFLLSSAWGEAFPLAVAEAMAAGVPCVVTDVGDCAELVGPTGAVVAPRDIDAMAAAIHQLVDLEPAERVARGLAGRTRVAERFSFDPYIQAHEGLYESALHHRRFGRANQDAHVGVETSEQPTERLKRPEATR
ncbi:MAG: glycosyltransferase [Pseudomonadota bacterium]